MTTDNRRCQATNASGEPCGAPPSMVDPEKGLCPAHQKGGRERLSAAGRKGAEAVQRRLRGDGLQEEDLPPLESPQAAERWLEAVGRAVATGSLGHNEGRTVVRAVREFLRAHEAGKVSEQLQRLMDALSEWRKTGDPEPVLELVEGGGS